MEIIIEHIDLIIEDKILIIILILLAIFLAIFFVNILNYLLFSKNRNKKIILFARENNLEYNEKDPFVIAPIKHFEVYNERHDYENVLNILTGTDKNAIMKVFDYESVQCGNKLRSDYGGGVKDVQTIVYFKGENLEFPPYFFLCPEGIWQKIKKIGGYEDINFIDYPIFSEKYILQCVSEAEARKHFTHDVIRYFEQYQRLRLSVEGKYDELIVYKSKKIVSGREIGTFIDTAKEVYNLFA